MICPVRYNLPLQNSADQIGGGELLAKSFDSMGIPPTKPFKTLPSVHEHAHVYMHV